MRFMLDENVPADVADMLRNRGHDVEWTRDYLAPGANDPLVASISELEGAVLISFDGDFENIAPRIPLGQRRRFRRLSRIWMRCSEMQAVARLEMALDLIETEFGLITPGRHQMRITVGASYLRTDR